MTQTEKILEFMKENGSITPMDALSEFGCMRLAARISDIRADGVNVVSTMEQSKNRYGETVRFARYRLED